MDYLTSGLLRTIIIGFVHPSSLESIDYSCESQKRIMNLLDDLIRIRLSTYILPHFFFYRGTDQSFFLFNLNKKLLMAF